MQTLWVDDAAPAAVKLNKERFTVTALTGFDPEHRADLENYQRVVVIIQSGSEKLARDVEARLRAVLPEGTRVDLSRAPEHGVEAAHSEDDELSLAARFLSEHRHTLRYVGDVECWIVWNKICWRGLYDTTGEGKAKAMVQRFLAKVGREKSSHGAICSLVPSARSLPSKRGIWLLVNSNVNAGSKVNSSLRMKVARSGAPPVSIFTCAPSIDPGRPGFVDPQESSVHQRGDLGQVPLCPSDQQQLGAGDVGVVTEHVGQHLGEQALAVAPVVAQVDREDVRALRSIGAQPGPALQVGPHLRVRLCLLEVGVERRCRRRVLGVVGERADRGAQRLGVVREQLPRCACR